MYAECTRQSCAQQASVLLAFDPRGARAWLRDLGDADPSMGLMLCPDHAQMTTVPMSWTLIDERSEDLDQAMQDQVESPPPSFDDIFPPRSAREPDPYGLDPDLETERPLEADGERAAAPTESTPSTESSDFDTTWDADTSWDEGDYALGPSRDGHESHEAVEWLAPELPASGTDGAPIRQPQLPMISAPTQQRPDPQNGSRYGDASAAPGVAPGDFLFTESPEDQLPTGAPVAPGDHTTHETISVPPVSAPPMMGAPLFENTTIRTPRQAPPTSPLLSRAFRTAQFD